MGGRVYSFTAPVWEYDGQAAWHFISLPEPDADEIDEVYGHRAKGFGSIRVRVTIGTTTWDTSIFPDNKRATYILPIKKAVRTAQNLTDGRTASVRLEVLM
jgi:Domain of unknown function (DUF1905)